MKDLYESIFKNSPVAKSLSTYEDGIFIEVNDSFCNLTEYSKEEIIGHKSVDLKLFNSFSRQKMLDLMDKDGNIKNAALEITTRNNQIKQGLFSAEILDFKGQKCLLTAFVDITEIKNLTNTLKEREELLIQSQHIANIGHYVFDLIDDNWTSSEMLKEIFGIDENYKADYDGWLQIVHPDFRNEMDKYFNSEVIDKKTKFDREYKIINQKTQEERWVRGLGTLDYLQTGDIKRMFGIIQDITEEKQVQQLQILSNKILRSLNSNNNLKDTITNIIKLIKQETKYSAIGIRLKKNEDFPYFAQNGFTEDFVSNEDSLIVKNEEGTVCRDKDSKPLLECACGLVLNGKKNKALTKVGSLYTNDSKVFLDLTPSEDPRINPRNRCIHAGYNSIAIIPIRTKEVIIGTLQLNDRKENAFTEEIIIFFEGICELIGAALMRKQTEELLKQSEEKFREIFDEAPIGIALYSNAGTLINMNEACLKIFGVESIDNIRYLNLFKHPHPIESFNSAEILKSLEETDSWEGNVNFDFDKIRSHGNLISNRTGVVYLYLNIINFNGDNSFLVMVQDVTVTNNYVFQIKESEEKFRNIFYKSPIAINIYNEDGILQDVNEKSIEMMGVFGEIDKNEWLKFNLFDDPNLPKNLKEILESNSKWEGESVFDFDQFKTYFPQYNINKSGKMVLRISIVAQEISKDSKYIVQLQDITEYKEYTEKLKELNDTKDKFFSIISHDLRSPFNSILGFTEILNESYFKYTDEERLNFIRNIKNSALNAFELLQNLLDWANTQTKNDEYYPEYLDMSLLLNNVIKTVGPSALIKNIKIYSLINYKTDCYGDEEMIKTILRNLLTNAIKFTNKNGNVLISSEYIENYLKVTVKDNGIGISQTTINKLFKIGEKVRKSGTDQERGTGLGLIICKEFITKMGGDIWVESEIDKGSKFTFTIPIMG